MLAVPPQLPAGVAHLPRTPALHPETPLFLRNRHPALRVQAPQYTIFIYKILQSIPTHTAIAIIIHDCLVLCGYGCAVALMHKSGTA